MGAKWLELLKQIAPGLTRVTVLRDASQGFAVSQFVAIQTMAPALGVEVIPVNMRDAGEIEQSVATFARSPNGGLIPIPSAAAVHHRDLILTLGGPLQTAGGLLGTLVRRCRRPDLLWA
jgi:putative ABC transport system substrate-binding protein